MMTKNDLMNSGFSLGATKLGGHQAAYEGHTDYTISQIEISGKVISGDNVSKDGKDAVIHEVNFGKIVVYEDGDYYIWIDFSSDFVRSIPSLGAETMSIPFIALDGDGNAIGGNNVHTLSIPGFNNGPEAADDHAAGIEDKSIIIDMLSNDSDPDTGDTIMVLNGSLGHDDGAGFVAGVSEKGGTVTLNSDGTVLYVPAKDFHGADSFTYKINDENGETSTATVTIDVASVNDTPDAVDDAVTTAEDTPITVNVLANDTDPDGDTLSVIAVSNGANGTAAIVNGKIVYTPNADFHGNDEVTYKISDGNGTQDIAQLRITVTPVNDRPDALNDAVTTAENTPITVNVLANDTDPDGDFLTITNVTSGAHGTAKIVSGKIVYTPNADFHGNDQVFYTISDGNGGEDTARLRITIEKGNKAPDAVNDAVTTAENTPIAVNVLANDTDPDGDQLTITAVTAGAHGTAAIVNGKIVYTPDDDFHGNDEVFYTVSDGNGGEDTARLRINIEKNNEGPDAVNDAVTTAENTPITVNVLSNDTDPDGDQLTITNVTAGAHGTTAIVNGKIVYTPDDNFHGNDQVFYTVSDGNGGEDTARLRITVDKGNEGPDAVNDAVTTSLDTPITVNVLANDTDPDGDSLTITNVTAGAHGTAKIVNGKIVYTPDDNFEGKDEVLYTISDGNGGEDTARLRIDVVDNNERPDAVNDYLWHNGEDGSRAEVMTGNLITGEHIDPTGKWNHVTIEKDTDDDGDDLSIVKLELDGIDITIGDRVWFEDVGHITIDADGSFKYEPFIEDDTWGKIKMTYTVSDGRGGEDEALVTVKRVSPVAFDLDRSGFIETTGTSTSYAYEGEFIEEGSVSFDMDNDGNLEQVDWLKSGKDAFLVDDRDGMAMEDMDGGRLFGDEGGTYSSGYEKLAMLDTDGDAVLRGDELSGLKLWLDDGDAVVEDGELQTLEQHGFTEIRTDMEIVYDEDGAPLMRSTATTSDGEVIMTEDIWVGSSDATAAHSVSEKLPNDLDTLQPDDIHDWS